MRLLKCLKQDLLLEFASIPQEMSFLERTRVRTHTFSCAPCREKLASIQRNWESYLKPEPEITSSLLKVYSKLQNDETLILKGWKLGENTRRRDLNSSLLNGGWLFRGAVSLGLGSVLLFVVISQINLNRADRRPMVAANNPLPLAQIRVEEKNKVKVHYLEPELLQTIEFETTRGAR
jgi:hypothetical protein